MQSILTEPYMPYFEGIYFELMKTLLYEEYSENSEIYLRGFAHPPPQKKNI